MLISPRLIGPRALITPVDPTIYLFSYLRIRRDGSTERVQCAAKVRGEFRFLAEDERDESRSRARRSVAIIEPSRAESLENIN